MELSQREAGLLRAREVYGEEVEAALRKHLSMVGEEFYMWMADLYIPRDCKCDNFDDEGNRICLLPRDKSGKCLCHGGGFYFSNSGRDNEPFDIDIESTVQAIRFFESSGMIADYGNDLTKAMPKQMQKDVISFAKSLQDKEDGYFYHPQWGKDIIPSRQGRDLGWATSILKVLGDAPLYDTKNGHKGTLGAPSGMKKDNDENATNNSSWISHLQTIDAFKEYLASFDLKNKSYSSGNNINAQASQFVARDKQAIADGELEDKKGDGKPEGGFVDTLEKFFNERQNAENGLWEDEVHYNSVNGLMKLVASYNTIGLKFNYVDEAFESAMKMALLPVDEPDVKGKLAKTAVDVYNPWVVLSALISNAKEYGTPEDVERLKRKLSDNVLALVLCTGEKAIRFKKPDGSFGYDWGAVDGFSQMAPVCVSGIVEGGINGGLIAVNGIWRNMCHALALNIPIFTPRDYEKFINRIKKNCGYN